VLYALLTDPDDYQRAVAYGNAVSAAKDTVPGDQQTAGLAQIEDIIRAHHAGGPQMEMAR